MFLAPRKFAFLVLAGLALAAAGCGASNNKGKIEGKWKITSLPNQDAKSQQEFDTLNKMGLYVYLDFRPDSVLTMAIGSEKPETLKMIQAMAPGQKTSWDAKYKLLSGDKVELYDVKDEDLKKVIKGDKARSDITISGDEMTIKDPDGSVTKLTRLKDAPAAGDKDAKRNQ